MDRFRCRVGHAFGGVGVLEGNDDALEAGLYAAPNTLEEAAGVVDSLAVRAAERFEARARRSREQATSVRRVHTDGAAQNAV